MIRPFRFLGNSSGIAALCAIGLAGCAASQHANRADGIRHGSIKDDPVEQASRSVRAADATPARTAHKIAYAAPLAHERREAPAQAPALLQPPKEITRPAARAAAEPAAPPAAAESPLVITPPAAKPAATMVPIVPTLATEPKSVPTPRADTEMPKAPPVVVLNAEPPAAPAPRPAIVVKPVEAAPVPAPEARPTADARRKALDMLPPPKVAAVPPSTGQAVVMAPVAPQAAVHAATPAHTPKADTKPAPTPEIAIAALSNDQRVVAALEQADTYMKSGRFQSARTLLEDLAKAGDPSVLTALAETFDPLTLRERYPRLSRTGDPERALVIYEQARGKGAKGLEQRIAALKALAGPR